MGVVAIPLTRFISKCLTSQTIQTLKFFDDFCAYNFGNSPLSSSADIYVSDLS